jgi:hypothetical protein
MRKGVMQINIRWILKAYPRCILLVLCIARSLMRGLR